MRRREFLIALGGVLSRPGATSAQQAERIRRVAILMGVAENDYTRGVTAEIPKGLREIGWVEGTNIQIETRWSPGDVARTQAFAKELVAFQPDLIIAHTDSSVIAVRRETTTIPIVFLTVSDPVGLGFVSSLSHPGGNSTGFINFEPGLGGKWLEALREIAPTVTRVGVAYNPKIAPRSEELYLPSLRKAAEARGIEVLVRQVEGAEEVERLVADLGSQPGGGLVVIPDNSITGRNAWLVSLTQKHRIPVVHPYPYFPAGGGLMSYGIDPVDSFRKVPTYVDRVLRGAKPQDLPVQLPTKFRLVINLKTAKALDLQVPPSLLTQADEVIE